MVKEDVTKKWLVLLIVLVALSLVVDLLSLNVLYSIGDGGNLEGELAESPYDDSCVFDCIWDCIDQTYLSYGQCKQHCKDNAYANGCCYYGELSYPYPEGICCDYYEKQNGLC